MKISVFGLGYVGAVFSGCLAKDGHEVIGVDPNVTKVELINKGLSHLLLKKIFLKLLQRLLKMAYLERRRMHLMQ